MSAADLPVHADGGPEFQAQLRFLRDLREGRVTAPERTQGPSCSWCQHWAGEAAAAGEAPIDGRCRYRRRYTLFCSLCQFYLAIPGGPLQ